MATTTSKKRYDKLALDHHNTVKACGTLYWLNSAAANRARMQERYRWVHVHGTEWLRSYFHWKAIYKADLACAKRDRRGSLPLPG